LNGIGELESNTSVLTSGGGTCKRLARACCALLSFFSTERRCGGFLKIPANCGCQLKGGKKK